MVFAYCDIWWIPVAWPTPSAVFETTEASKEDTLGLWIDKRHLVYPGVIPAYSTS